MSLQFIPKILSVDITNKCNNNCKYCRDIHNNISRKLSNKTFKRRIKNIVGQIEGVKWMKLSGGEPLLELDTVKDFVNFCSQRGINTLLQTNGFLLNNETVLSLKKAGISKIQISIDGGKRKHDELRGRGSYKKIINALERCMKHDIIFQLKCTITNKNKDSLEDIFRIALYYPPERLNFRFLLPIGRANSKEFKEIDSSKRKEIIDQLYTLSNNYGVEIITGDPCSYLYLFKHLKSKQFSYYESACNIGIDSIHISSDGFLKPCSMIDYSLGDILKDDFWDIWKNNDFLKKNREKNFVKCGICRYKYNCGGCRAVAFANYGSYFEKDNSCFMFCKENNL